jgi:hypothetical protein
MELIEQQLNWLLEGYDVVGYQAVKYQSMGL